MLEKTIIALGSKSARNEIRQFVEHLAGMDDAEVGQLVAVSTMVRHALSGSLIPPYLFEAGRLAPDKISAAVQFDLGQQAKTLQSSDRLIEAAGISVWRLSLAALGYPGLRNDGRAMWREMRRGFQTAFDWMEEIEAQHLVDGLGGWDDFDLIPYGLEPELNSTNSNKVRGPDASELLGAWLSADVMRRAEELRKTSSERNRRREELVDKTSAALRRANLKLNRASLLAELDRKIDTQGVDLMAITDDFKIDLLQSLLGVFDTGEALEIAAQLIAGCAHSASDTRLETDPDSAGLALCRKLAKRHGVELKRYFSNVESENLSQAKTVLWSWVLVLAALAAGGAAFLLDAGHWQ